MIKKNHILLKFKFVINKYLNFTQNLNVQNIRVVKHSLCNNHANYYFLMDYQMTLAEII
jgi:hypothetical protein